MQLAKCLLNNSGTTAHTFARKYKRQSTVDMQISTLYSNVCMVLDLKFSPILVRGHSATCALTGSEEPLNGTVHPIVPLPWSCCTLRAALWGLKTRSDPLAEFLAAAEGFA